MTVEQRGEIESLTEALRHRNTLVDFEKHLVEEQWQKETIDNKEIWICQANTEFQISFGKSNSGFREPWTQCYPNKSSSVCPVYLKIGTAVIKELLFVYMDEYRIFVPMAEVRQAQKEGDKYEYYWNTNSLEVKVCNVIGHYSIHNSLQNVADISQVSLED